MNAAGIDAMPTLIIKYSTSTNGISIDVTLTWVATGFLISSVPI